jgi:hypothetical protein
MAEIIMAGGSGKTYYQYKQGVFHNSKLKPGEIGYTEREFEKKDGTKEIVGGGFASGIGGFVTDVRIREVEKDGKVMFKTLNVTLDNDTVISMGLESEAAEMVFRTFANVDVNEKTTLIAWKDGKDYSKLSIKQGGKHVVDSFVEFDAETKTAKHINGYPERAPKGADDADKTIAKAMKQKFLLAHFNDVIQPKFEAVKVEGVQASAPAEDTGYGVYDEPEMPDVVDPADIPF